MYIGGTTNFTCEAKTISVNKKLRILKKKVYIHIYISETYSDNIKCKFL